MRKILVTSGLPYANGPIHLGHLVEYIQTDIWARFQNHIGNKCYYVCGDDSHGTPIMLNAEKKNLSTENMIQKIYTDHKDDLEAFNIRLDIYDTTQSQENKKFVNFIYSKLKENNDLETKEITQAFDEQKNIFLPDRYVKGECPKCGAKNQYGDSCDECSSVYSPLELVNPISVISGTKPIQKKSLHLFFKLDKYEDVLQHWIKNGHLQNEIANKLTEWFKDGLKRWDISRDAPYFGFEIEDMKNKFFYVWLDAPIGYISAFSKLCKKNKEINFEDFWSIDNSSELYHFVGKDIIYFHALFWPAILTSAGFRKPSAIFTHGFLTINGTKMSKSKGTFITARSYLNNLNPEYLRYYFASKLNNKISDIDLNFDDFIKKNNSDLVGKLINIASRSSGFITRNFNGELSSTIEDEELYSIFLMKNEIIKQHYENREFSYLVKEIMKLADLANQYIDKQKPWILSKENKNNTKIQDIATCALNLFRIITIYIKPILPELSTKIELFFNIEPLVWNDLEKQLLNHKINKFKTLLKRVEEHDVENILNS